MAEPKKYQIEVTKQDIEQGECKSPWRCPIALAINRVMQPGCRAYVDYDTVIIACQDYRLPPEASQFVDRFDDQASVSPFSFSLEQKPEWPE